MPSLSRVRRPPSPTAALAIVCWLATIGTALAQGTAAPEKDEPRPLHAQPCLILAVESATPGSTVDLGVRFTIEPGWHLYWNGKNDTGQAPKVNLDLPPGVTAGPMLWPAPSRHVMAGDIIDHIYETEVTLIVPLTVGKDAQADRPLAIRAECSWLVCEKVCLLERGTSEVTLRVSADGAARPAEANAELIEKARARVPRTLEPDTEGIVVRWGAGGVTPPTTLVILAKGVTALEFYPGLECADLAEPIADTRTETDHLRLRVAGSQLDSQKAVTGVLAVWKGSSGGVAYYSIHAGRPR